MKQRLKDWQNGSILIAIIIMLPFLILIVTLYMQLTVSGLKLAKQDQSNTHAQLAADAGADFALQQINQNSSWTGTGSQVVLHNENGVRTTYEALITSIDADNKVVTSIGRSFRPPSSTTPSSTVTLKVDLRAVSSGEYSVVSGVGGLIMSNSAKILGGDVFINGKITLTNSAQIGLTTSSVNVYVAHNSCPQPPNATYPRICNSGENGQPISLQNSSKIYGNVRANNQTTGTNILNPGLTASSGVASQPLPSHDRNAQKAAALTPVPPYNTNWSCSSGNYSWPANVKITGNVNISNTCKVTVNGNVWITGTIQVSNSAQLIVSNSLGATRPVIMFDGNSAQFSNSALLKSNSSNTGFMIIAYKSDASCSPDCTDVTGTDLYNSHNDQRIEIDNSASGPHSIFYARWTKVKVSNSGQLGALVGQTVELSNSGTITFGTSAGTGTSFWVVEGYRRQF